LSFATTAKHPFPFSVRKLKRPIVPLRGKFSTLSQQEKENPLLRGHCTGVLITIPYKIQKKKIFIKKEEESNIA
jgi:hypothetical protein